MNHQVIAISTNKGGVLKTSITTNLAGLFANEGERVLLIDTDNQGNVAVTFGQNPDDYGLTLYDVLVDKRDPMDVIVPLTEKIDLLPCNDDMAFFEFDVLTRSQGRGDVFRLLGDILPELRERYDRILIDTPPNLGLTQGNVLAATDAVLIPFHPEKYSMRSLTKILKAIREFKSTHNAGLQILGVVPTLVNKRTMLHKNVLLMAKDYLEAQQLTMFRAYIPLSVQFATAVAFEEAPITLSSPSSEHAGYYQELLNEIRRTTNDKGGE